MNILNVILMAPPDGGGGGGSSIGTFLMLGAIMLVFYLFMIRPQMKKSKEQRKFKETLQKGDRIVTIGGIHGKIAEMKDTTLIIEVEGGNRLKIEKGAVSMESTAQLGKNN